MSQEAFYEPDGERLVPSELTRGPWDPDAQHAGPPAALGRAIERCEPREGGQVARVTLEILGPVPLAPLTASARVVRPGRSVELLEASLSAPDGEVMHARAWRLITRPTDLDPRPAPDPPPPGPDRAQERDFFPTGRPGYHTAMDSRFLRGAFLEPGPAMVWMRQRPALVAGEAPSPLERVLVVADAGNGVSAALDWRRYVFINTDLSVHLKRLPEGGWIGLDAVTWPEPHGIGLTDSVLWDEGGRLGRAVQTLLVRER